jgi:hypothetical protein
VNIRMLVTAVLLAGLASSANAMSYYVVQNMRTYKCAVAIHKPSPKNRAKELVGDGTVYKSKKEATAAIKTIAACNIVKRPQADSNGPGASSALEARSITRG